ncbi:hypothetical protein O7626_25635 [Micromonospora sp. WMMD1102]|uniref:hypothetical protein n=1 Tax=Micromonospora sp. WMMD1102 TaxID=3016105 RepID=UPI002415536F|nr:hypothetical protein [Micromonospora sp. WMMD1102]MDG4789270.1 hypothetical protein [Micromonospora sp. WMMD1102]
MRIRLRSCVIAAGLVFAVTLVPASAPAQGEDSATRNTSRPAALSGLPLLRSLGV